jgi:hypothetical protein
MHLKQSLLFIQTLYATLMIFVVREQFHAVHNFLTSYIIVTFNVAYY